jgi:hypothetical protein
MTEFKFSIVEIVHRNLATKSFEVGKLPKHITPCHYLPHALALVYYTLSE